MGLLPVWSHHFGVERLCKVWVGIDKLTSFVAISQTSMPAK